MEVGARSSQKLDDRYHSIKTPARIKLNETSPSGSPTSQLQRDSKANHIKASGLVESRTLGWGCSSVVVEHFPGMCHTLGSILSTRNF
jgi:hypothetical protein